MAHPAGAAPAKDIESHVPNHAELAELVRNVKLLGTRLSRGRSFDSHFRDHRNLLEGALGKSYRQDPAGGAEFLRDLGQLISSGRLKPLGIATIRKNEPMVYVFQGRVGFVDLTAMVRPGGEWVTLLATGIGMTLGLQYQMQFDSPFPFPFLRTRPSGGFGRSFS